MSPKTFEGSGLAVTRDPQKVVRKVKPKREPIPLSIFYYDDIGDGLTTVTSYHELKYYIHWGNPLRCSVSGRFLPEHELWTNLSDD